MSYQTTHATDSRELIRLMQAGDSQAGNRLFSRYLPILQGWGRRRIPRWARGIAETGDVVQDAVLRTLRNVRTFEAERTGALLGYLRKALVNRIRDQVRHAVRHPMPVPLDDEQRDSASSPFDELLSHERRELYRLSLARLSGADRDAIVGRLELAYSYEQLAVALGKRTSGAARLAVRRALLRLAAQMKHARP